MITADDATTRLLKELSDAKAWPELLKRKLDSGTDVSDEIGKANEKIEGLKRRAEEAIKSLGCVSPETRSVYHGMADMLISWQTFKDSLE